MRISARVYLAHTSKAGRLMQGIRIDSKPLDEQNWYMFSLKNLIKFIFSLLLLNISILYNEYINEIRWYSISYIRKRLATNMRYIPYICWSISVLMYCNINIILIDPQKNEASTIIGVSFLSSSCQPIFRWDINRSRYYL